jgi:GR25 family glycosyltransferase involved in LPS biosynthesis
MWSIPIYGISIRAKRKAAFLKRIGTLKQHVKAIVGVNGASLKPQHSCAPKIKLKRGQIGCFCSHRQIWKQIIKARHRYASVFEDDVQFKSGFIKKTLNAVRYVSKHYPAWDVIYLGRNYKNRHNKASIGPSLVVAGASWGMFGYLISLRGVKKLLAHSSVQKFTAPCDVLLSKLGLAGYLNSYAISPCICQYLTLGSDTRNIK